jgi:hypothetical protein
LTPSFPWRCEASNYGSQLRDRLRATGEVDNAKRIQKFKLTNPDALR